jgi:hypothetical protein
MSYLTFEKHGERTYAIKNSSNELIGFIERIRNGQWMHYSLTIPAELMKECVNQGMGLTFSPSCQDEIRKFCKELNGKCKIK